MFSTKYKSRISEAREKALMERMKNNFIDKVNFGFNNAQNLSNEAHSGYSIIHYALSLESFGAHVH